MKKIAYIVVFLVTVLILLEFVLRFVPQLKTYSEQNFGVYQSAYDASNVSNPFVWSKNDSAYSVQTEFSFAYITNNKGLLSNKSSEADSSSLVFLGDSFTFGVGASQDSSFPVLISNALNCSVINAGIPGSDPFFEKQLIDSLFVDEGYSNFVFTLNFSDIYDFVVRGGAERFKDDGELSFRASPPIETLYKYSYLTRAIVHKIFKMDFSLQRRSTLLQLKKEAINQYAVLLTDLNKHYNVCVVLLPYPRQYANNSAVLSEVLNYTYLDSLEDLLLESGTPVINLNTELSSILTESNYLDYSWPLDGHYNSKGYLIIAEILENKLPEYFDFCKDKNNNFVDDSLTVN